MCRCASAFLVQQFAQSNTESLNTSQSLSLIKDDNAK